MEEIRIAPEKIWHHVSKGALGLLISHGMQPSCNINSSKPPSGAPGLYGRGRGASAILLCIIIGE